MEKFIKKNQKKIIVILGSTSSGKTSLSVKLAVKFNSEIVSADSRQVYRGMDIGTGKDLKEFSISNFSRRCGTPLRRWQFSKKRKEIKIPYHLIDVASPKKRFSLADYQKQAYKAIEDILRRDKLPIVVGGSGLYLQAIVDDYQLSATKPDLKLRKKLKNYSLPLLKKLLQKLDKKKWLALNISEQKNSRRLIRYIEIAKSGSGDKIIKTEKPKYEFLVIGLNLDKELLHKRIYQRLIQRLEQDDMVGEVEQLHEKGISWQRLEEFGLEYKHIAQYLQKKISYDEMKSKLFQELKKFSKRQGTWFMRWERQGRKINWIKNRVEAEKLIKQFLK